MIRNLKIKNILVLCPSAWDLEELQQPRLSGAYRFLFHGAEYRKPRLTFNALRFLSRTLSRFKTERIDGVIGTDDYLACALSAAAAGELGLPGPSPEAVLRCQHKYYTRLAERELFPDSTPRFELLHPTRQKEEDLSLDFPFFVKPVKATFSIMAREVRSLDDLNRLVKFSPMMRFVSSRIMRPFNQLLDRYGGFEYPGNNFIGEELLRGTQVTVEGFVYQGEVEILGVVDCTMYPGTNSFQRFEYPSRLDGGIRERLADRARRLVRHIGFDNSMFNMEFFYDAPTDTLRVIEINARMCYQFADLYEKVDGINSYDIQLALATGERPTLSRGRGKYPAAASFALKSFEDRRIVRLPDPGQVEDLRDHFPDTRVKLYGREGRRLSKELEPYVEGYRYAIVNMGGENREDVQARYREALEMIPFQFANVR